MHRIQEYSGALLPHMDTANTHWAGNPGAGRAGKALICVSLFSVIVFVSLACVLAALLRAFPA